jgi:hypothetical protein
MGYSAIVLEELGGVFTRHDAEGRHKLCNAFTGVPIGEHLKRALLDPSSMIKPTFPSYVPSPSGVLISSAWRETRNLRQHGAVTLFLELGRVEFTLPCIP